MKEASDLEIIQSDRTTFHSAIEKRAWSIVIAIEFISLDFEIQKMAIPVVIERVLTVAAISSYEITTIVIVYANVILISISAEHYELALRIIIDRAGLPARN